MDDKEREEQTGLPAEEADIYKIPEDKMRGWYRDFRADFGMVAAVLFSLMPVFMALVMVVLNASVYRFPRYDLRISAMLLVLLIPSVILFLIRKRKKLRVLKVILAILCLLVTPLIFYGGLFSPYSSTERVSRYRVLDRGCYAGNDPAFQALFPEDVPLKDMPGSRYHYAYATTVFGESDNIYAEWRIEDGEAFEREVRRVQELFEEESLAEELKTLSLQHGSFRCLFLYDDIGPYEIAEPFTEPDSRYYWYCLFAWDEGTNTVRYYYGNSQNGDDPPYYLSLSWG
ncbi:MAG: hypothetical protein IK149_08530 [Oscillospiraceae bacterium]|nr:hypothetical protein [Oscillospiraceae bacterium]